MNNYSQNKQSKDSRFLAAFRKTFNKDRILNGFTIEEQAHALGMAQDTYDKKLKPSNDMNDITVTDWNTLLELAGDFSTLEYFTSKHGFALKKLDVVYTQKSTTEISSQVDTAMIEFGEAFKAAKECLSDRKVTKKEAIKVSSEIDEAIAELQQLKQDVNSNIDEE